MAWRSTLSPPSADSLHWSWPPLLLLSANEWYATVAPQRNPEQMTRVARTNTCPNKTKPVVRVFEIKMRSNEQALWSVKFFYSKLAFILYVFRLIHYISSGILDKWMRMMLNCPLCLMQQWSTTSGALHTQKKMYYDSEFLGRLSCAFRKLQMVNIIIFAPLDGSVRIEYRPGRNGCKIYIGYSTDTNRNGFRSRKFNLYHQ